MIQIIRQRLRFVFTISLLAGGLALSAAGHAIAQDGTDSHRRLELPKNSPSDPLQQVARLMQYLQTLKGQEEEHAGRQQPLDPASELDQIKEKLGPELGGMLDQLPPGVAENALRDPEVRNQVKDLLKDFVESGRLPDFIPGQGRSENSSSANRPSKPNQQQPLQSSDNGVGNQTSDAADLNRPRQPAKPNSTDERTRQSARERLEDLMEKFRERGRNPNASGFSQNDSQKKQSGQPAGSSNPRDPSSPRDSSEKQGGNRERPMTDAEWEQRLRDLIRKQRESVRRNQSSNERSGTPRPFPGDSSSGNGSGIENGESRNQNSPDRSPTNGDGRRLPIDSFPGGDQTPNGPGTSEESLDDVLDRMSGIPKDGQAAPSLSEFLDQMQDNPTPDLGDLGIELPSNPGQGPNGRSTSDSSGNSLSNALQKMNSKEFRDQARQALQDMGLRDTIKEIMKDAKNSAKQEATTEGQAGNLIADMAAATGMEDQMLKALGGLTEELVDAAKNRKSTEGGNSNSGTSNSPEADTDSSSSTALGSESDNTSESTQPSQSSGQKNQKSTFSSLTESASNAFKDFTKAPEVAAPSTASPDILPDLGSLNFTSIVLACLLVIFLVAALFIAPQLLPQVDSETSDQVIKSLLKQGIRTKEDVIRAFHQFALKPSHETQEWWTHARVVDVVATQYPQHSNRIQILSSLYEQARYLPDDTEFSEAMFQQAADAVRTVGVA